MSSAIQSRALQVTNVCDKRRTVVACKIKSRP